MNWTLFLEGGPKRFSGRRAKKFSGRRAKKFSG